MQYNLYHGLGQRDTAITLKAETKDGILDLIRHWQETHNIDPNECWYEEVPDDE